VPVFAKEDILNHFPFERFHGIEIVHFQIEYPAGEPVVNGRDKPLAVFSLFPPRYDVSPIGYRRHQPGNIFRAVLQVGRIKDKDRPFGNRESGLQRLRQPPVVLMHSQPDEWILLLIGFNPGARAVPGTIVDKNQFGLKRSYLEHVVKLATQFVDITFFVHRRDDDRDYERVLAGTHQTVPGLLIPCIGT
jgi:hypothetical protein